MSTIQLELPETITAQLEQEGIDEDQLDAFLIAAVEAWLTRRQSSKGDNNGAESHAWSNAFKGDAVAFVDKLIEENRSLFEELARL